MIIGYMRNFNKPNYLCRLTAKMAKYYGLEIIYLRPKDIDTTSSKVVGKMFISNEWRTVETDLPMLFDVSPYCFKPKNRKVIQYLKRKSHLTDNRENLSSKEQLQEHLGADDRFSHLVIPTKKLTDFKVLKESVREFKTIVIKPISGERGKGIYILRSHDEGYLIGHQKREKVVSEKELEVLYKENFLKGYIIQKYVSSCSKQGDPFDCRIHFEKNGMGQWEVAKMYIRIGIGQKVISNMNQGGGMADPKSFLKANFGKRWKEIYDNLQLLAKEFPYKIEQLRKADIMSLGIDVGIDTKGSLYVFEANGAPATGALKAEVVDLRTQYYRYLIDNKINKL